MNVGIKTLALTLYGLILCFVLAIGFAQAGTYVGGGFSQDQNSIDLYVENGAIAGPDSDLAGSADILVVQGSSMNQSAHAYGNANSYTSETTYPGYYYPWEVLTYDTCYNPTWGGYTYNWSDLAHDANVVVAPVQFQEKLTVVDTGYGTLQMYQGGFQGGIIEININTGN
jgi:hypothetical protein